ncbi:MAG: hypothetical protein CL623_05455 [Arcobacter sp.]|nr:hypothetical protein [Arcobacter sp.]
MSNYIDFMIQVDELNKLLENKENIVIIDVRLKEEYEKGHIESAVNFPEVFTYLPKGITTKKEKESFKNFFQELFSKAGISKDEIVIFYEDKFTLKAPRGLTILKYLGYEEKKIKVLDGGYIKWKEDSFKTSKIVTENIRKRFIPKVDESFFVDYNEVLSYIDNPKVIKLDVRDKDEWVGISSSPFGMDFAPKKGRLPNAIWIEWYKFITSNMLSVEVLDKIQEELKKKNINKTDDIVLYCFKGARLSNSYIALRKLGYENIRIYFVGWNEWCRKENAPIINEVENDENPLLKENIELKNTLDSIYLKNANLIDFPKYNKEPIFAFSREGTISFENKPKKIKLPNITKISDIFPAFEIEDIYNMIDNQLNKSTTIQVKDKYFLINCIGSRETNNILTYGFETTQRENLNKTLLTQYELIKNIINTVPVRIFWKDKDCRYLGANRLFLEDAGFTDIDEIIGKSDFDMPWDKTEAQQYIIDDLSIMNEGIEKINYEEFQTHENGETSVILTSKIPLRDESNNIIGILSSYADITHQREMEIELKKQKDILSHQAHHDALTGLPNRTLFQDKLKQSIEFSKRKKTKTALLFIDLDHFKEINDSFGHDIGDEILKTVSNRLKKVVREEDTVSRFGGDEFTIIIGELNEAQDSSIIAKKVLKILSEPINTKTNTFYISSSIGISIYPDDGQSTQNLLKYADSAMYKAKDEGRSNFQYYNSSMTELAFERVVMEASLRRALKEDQFVVFYQAQINGITDEIIGFEALIRWEHPTMGLVSPAKFVPLAQSTGLIVDIDRIVMKKAMTQVSQWYKEGLNPGVLAINLAVKQLHKKDFVEIFKELMFETECKAKWIELEVTEDEIMTNPEEAINILSKISALGVELAVDDFGTGYSSLAYLKRLPIDKLKIDKAFVRDLPDDEEDAGITKAVIALAKSLNLKVIAEGVETKEQKEFLVKNGCEYIQGYLYSRPMPAVEFDVFLRKGFKL